MSLLNTIKRAGLGAVESANPVAIMMGKIKSVNPLEVAVDQRLTLSEDFLIVPESLIKYEIDVKHSHSYSNGTTGEALPQKLLIRRGLEAGDIVLLLRYQGGQQFVILDRVVSA